MPQRQNEELLVGQGAQCKDFTELFFFLCFLSLSVHSEIPHPCHPNPCKNEAKCKELGAGEYDCECPPGTSGKHCEGSCILPFTCICEFFFPCRIYILYHTSV